MIRVGPAPAATSLLLIISVSSFLFPFGMISQGGWMVILPHIVRRSFSADGSITEEC